MSHSVVSIEPSAIEGGTNWLRSGMFVDAEPARDIGDAARADFVGDAGGDRVDRERERGAQRDRAAIAFVVIARTPAIDDDRLVVAHVFGVEARFERGGVDERLERRARLAAALG